MTHQTMKLRVSRDDAHKVYSLFGKPIKITGVAMETIESGNQEFVDSVVSFRFIEECEMTILGKENKL